VKPLPLDDHIRFTFAHKKTAKRFSRVIKDSLLKLVRTNLIDYQKQKLEEKGDKATADSANIDLFNGMNIFEVERLRSVIHDENKWLKDITQPEEYIQRFVQTVKLHNHSC